MQKNLCRYYLSGCGSNINIRNATLNIRSSCQISEMPLMTSDWPSSFKYIISCRHYTSTAIGQILVRFALCRSFERFQVDEKWPSTFLYQSTLYTLSIHSGRPNEIHGYHKLENATNNLRMTLNDQQSIICLIHPPPRLTYDPFRSTDILDIQGCRKSQI